ncbi:MAG: DUF6084 family protein [Candidatus Dormibacteria bacterium]
MPELTFEVLGATAKAFCATPTILFHLRVGGPEGELIKGVSLETQIRIDAHTRRYNAEEKGNLYELFGEASRWSETVRSLLWTLAVTNVPPFTGSVEVDLPVPCTYDFNVISAKYFYGLEEGNVPLTLLFSGTVFYYGEENQLQIERVPWSKEAVFSMPVSTWKDVMQMYYPNIAWLALRQDAFELLARYKAENSFATFEQAIESLVPAESRI